MKNKVFFDHTKPKPEILAAIALFILWGLILIFYELPREWAFPNWVYYGSSFLFLVLITLLPFVVSFSWIKNFPGWSYPYVVSSLFIYWYVMNVASPDILFYRELWGWRAWIPLMVVMVSLLITQSFQPLRKLIIDVLDDWSLLTFGFFGCMPMFIFVYFDEINKLYSLFFMVILSLLMAGSVYLYMQSKNQGVRIRVLLISIFLIITLVVAGSTIYWLYNGGTNIFAPVGGGIIVYLLMFSPALISLFQRSRKV